MQKFGGPGSSYLVSPPVLHRRVHLRSQSKVMGTSWSQPERRKKVWRLHAQGLRAHIPATHFPLGRIKPHPSTREAGKCVISSWMPCPQVRCLHCGRMEGQISVSNQGSVAQCLGHATIISLLENSSSSEVFFLLKTLFIYF